MTARPTDTYGPMGHHRNDSIYVGEEVRATVFDAARDLAAARRTQVMAVDLVRYLIDAYFHHGPTRQYVLDHCRPSM